MNLSFNFKFSVMKPNRSKQRGGFYKVVSRHTRTINGEKNESKEKGTL
jgi:hypothetical protein